MGPKAIGFAHFRDLPTRLLKSDRTLYSDILINVLVERMGNILSDLNSRGITCGGKPSPGQEGNGLRRPEAFSLKDGNLVVTAAMINSNLVSGGMAQNINQTFGRYEFRVRVEKDSSDAMSAVVLTWPQSERWPMDGENDIYETGTNGDRHAFYTNIHYGTTANTQHSFVHDADASSWHIMSMEWTSEYIKIYRDSTLVWTMTDKNTIPRVNHHLCIQLDAFKPSIIKPVHMFVDWVKNYSLGN
jgi:hypothetical protein